MRSAIALFVAIVPVSFMLAASVRSAPSAVTDEDCNSVRERKDVKADCQFGTWKVCGDGTNCCSHWHSKLTWYLPIDAGGYTGKKPGVSSKVYYTAKDGKCVLVPGGTCKYSADSACTTHFETSWTLAECATEQ
jgi:hypothetical protein